MEIKPFDPEKHRNSAERIWREVGWIEDDPADKECFGHFVSAGDAIVAEHDGEAECLVTSAPGVIQYLGKELPFSCITGVTTSVIARKQGLAGKMTSMAIASAADKGAIVSGLGMFEQGFYDLLGFGSGSTEHLKSFAPSSLKVDTRPAIPRRLSKDDWQLVHESRINRFKCHGACTLPDPGLTRAEMVWSKTGYGLGYVDETTGQLTHHVWFGKMEGENGPLRVDWLAYRTWDQFRELLALIKGLGDQVDVVTMVEPRAVQIQDLIEQPMRSSRVTRQSKYEQVTRSLSWWQMRMLDIPGCLSKTVLPAGDLRFVVDIDDPIEARLDGGPWRGVGGEYVITLGKSSAAERGGDRSLPKMKATVGALTRLWLGIRSATSLSVTDNLSAPNGLLDDLDNVLRIPSPQPDWPF